MFIPTNAPSPKPSPPKSKAWRGRASNAPTAPPAPQPVTLTAGRAFNPIHVLMWWSLPTLIWLSQNILPPIKGILEFLLWYDLTAKYVSLMLKVDTFLVNRFDPQHNYRGISVLVFFVLLHCMAREAIRRLNAYLNGNGVGWSWEYVKMMVFMVGYLGSATLVSLTFIRDVVEPRLA